MIVTDLKYHLETKLVNKLDIIISRCTNEKTRKDGVLIVEGSEGEGKTNSSIGVAYYASHSMQRPIHMFFRLKELIEFAKNTEKKIIIWDEPALDSLSTDWWKETNKDLIRLLMTCRKKRHFFLFNFVKFYKFNEYVIVDRSLGLVHMYSKKEIIPGRFVYIRKKNLENLFNDYKKKKQRSYKRLKSFGGSFPLVEKHMVNMSINIEGHPNCSLADYERLKDQAIESIGRVKKKEDKSLKKYRELKKKVSSLKLPLLNKEQLTNQLGISDRTIYLWSHIPTKEGEKGGV